MVYSARDFITRALRLLQVVAAGETPAAEDLDDGLEVLHDWMEDLATQRASIFTVTRRVHPLSAGVDSYTIGPGATFDQPRPIWIETVSVIPDRTATPPLEIPLGRPISVQAYQAIPVKSTRSSWPDRVYYDHAFSGTGIANLVVYPVPDSSAPGLVLYTPEALSAFADLSTPYAFPQGYPRMIRYNLAVELAPDYETEPSRDVQRIARESLANVKRANRRPAPEAGFDPALTGRRNRRFAIYTGE